MTTSRKKVPALRFPEFRDEGEWVKTTLGEICEINKGQQLNTSELTSSGDYPAINGGVEPSGYTHEYNTSEHTIIISEGGNSCGFVNYITTRFWLGGHCYSINNINKNINKKFLYYSLKGRQLDIMRLRVGSGLPNIQKRNLINLLLNFTDKKEQQKIADFLSSVDELIDAQTEKLEALKAHKKGLLQQLFPAEGETTPALRFPEFRDTGDWITSVLDSLAKRVTNKNKYGISHVLTNSAIDGVVDQREYFDRDIANKDNLKRYYIVDEGDYVYNPRISSIAPVGPISKNKLGKGVMSPLYIVFRFDNSDNSFYEHYFKSTHWHFYIHTVSNSGARHDRVSISTNDFEQMPVPAPGLKEQQQIADFLSSVDELINAQTEKLEALKVYKKGLLQQMFV